MTSGISLELTPEEALFLSRQLWRSLDALEAPRRSEDHLALRQDLAQEAVRLGLVANMLQSRLDSPVLTDASRGGPRPPCTAIAA